MEMCGKERNDGEGNEIESSGSNNVMLSDYKQFFCHIF